jgi:hypothetical protein
MLSANHNVTSSESSNSIRKDFSFHFNAQGTADMTKVRNAGATALVSVACQKAFGLKWRLR